MDWKTIHARERQAKKFQILQDLLEVCYNRMKAKELEAHLSGQAAS